MAAHKINILCFCLFIACVMPTVGKSSHTMDNVLDFFAKADDDGLGIVWAHAVNSKALLEESCTDDTMMLETDVILRGIGTENQTDIPVLAHPPDTDSDITLVEWLDRVTHEPDKGMKLDFKYIEAVEPSAKIIQEKEDQLHAPLWVNADIVKGPNSRKDPISPLDFIETCNKYFPLTTMSLGFTTFWNESALEDMYTWQMIFDILQYAYPLKQPVTFPIRAIWCPRSWSKFTWLLGLKADFSITIWTGGQDVVDINGIVFLRLIGDVKRIYYDLPNSLMAEFKEVSEYAVILPTLPPPKWNPDLWETVPSGQENDFVFLSTVSVGIMGGQSPNSYAGWVQSKNQQRPTDIMFFRGRVQFVGKYGSSSSATTMLEVAFRTSGVLNNESGSGVLDGVIVSLGNDGTISIRDLKSGNEARLPEALPSAECYYFEARDDTAEATCHLEVTIVRCKDANEEPPNKGQTAKVDLRHVPHISEYEQFHVGLSKVGNAKDIIVEDFHVEGSIAVKMQCSFYLSLLVLILSTLLSESSNFTIF